jgi:hypothetical protein
VWSKDAFLCIIHDKMDHTKITPLKVANLQQNNIWAWTIAHYFHRYDCAWTRRLEICTIFEWVVAKWSQLGPCCGFCKCLRQFKFQSWNYCLNNYHKTHSSQVFCKGNCIVYMNYRPQIKLSIWSLCWKFCCFKSIIVWKITRINIC